MGKKRLLLAAAALVLCLGMAWPSGPTGIGFDQRVPPLFTSVIFILM
jgi:hypothetical protein